MNPQVSVFRITDFFFGNDFFGEIALLRKDLTRTAEVVAYGYCDLLELKAQDFRNLIDADHHLCEKIQRTAQDRIRQDGLEEA